MPLGIRHRRDVGELMPRLYWDFFGPRAEGTARHFERHLREFFEREALTLGESGVVEHDRFKWSAYCEVDDETADNVRRALKPQRDA